MKGYKITKPFTLNEVEINEEIPSSAQAKVKVSKALITLSDVLRFRGDLESDEIVLGSSGIGLVSETEANLFGLEKGKRVYIDPVKTCDECYNCKKGKFNNCSNPLSAGEDYDGFIRDFVATSPDKLFTLPNSVSDIDSLYIDYISRGIAIFDKMNIQKGDYVAVLGANNFGNIFSQLLIYYQAVPIIMTLDEEDLQIAKDSGIYYALGPNDNWQKEVLAITSGRLPDKVVFISESNISPSKAFALAGQNTQVAFTGLFHKSANISFLPAVKKQLDILCINSGFGNTATSINLIANKAIDFSHLKLGGTKYTNVLDAFNTLSEQYEREGKIYETIVEMI